MPRPSTFAIARTLSLCGLSLALACGPKKQSAEPPKPLTAGPAPVVEAEPEPEPEPVEPAQWVGDIAVPGSSMRMIVRLTPGDDGAWGATLDLPQSGLKEYPLRDVEVTDEGFDFVLAPAGAPEDRWAFVAVEHEPGGDRAVGTFEQAGQSFPVTLKRLAPGETYSAPRPQNPVEPFPYATRELELARGDVKLACTMVVPDGDAVYPAVALLSGSGAQNRDSELFEHRLFLVIADHLARSSIASIRCDDRGVGGSTGSYMETTHEELTEDALAMVLALAGDARINPKAIGILGHSEGGMLAPMAAARDPKAVAFIVLLSAPALSGATILERQSRDLGAAAGKDPESLDREAAAHRAVIQAIKRGASKDDLSEKLRTLIDLQVAGRGIDEATKDAMTNQALGQMTSPWFKSFVNSDPQPALRKLKRTAVLAIGGELDLQVRAGENLAGIEKALKKARNKDVTTQSFPGLNHILQPALTGTVEEYATIETTISPEVLTLVSDWIGERFAPGHEK